MSINQEKLTRRTKLMYGVGDAGINMADTMVGLLFAIFLTDVVGLRPGLVAIALFIGRSMDYINDPIIGYFSDRVPHTLGTAAPIHPVWHAPLCAGVYADVVETAVRLADCPGDLLRGGFCAVRHGSHDTLHALLRPDARADRGL